MGKQNSFLVLILVLVLATITIVIRVGLAQRLELDLSNGSKQVERVLGDTVKLYFREQLPGTEEQFIAELQVQRQLLAEQELLQDSGDEEAIAQNLESLKNSYEAIAPLFKSPSVTNEDIIHAYPQPIQLRTDNWGVVIVFSSEGANKFAELTKNLAGTGRRVGIFLNNRLISSPVIAVEFAETGITGGRAVIQGRFSAEEANDLAEKLRGRL